MHPKTLAVLESARALMYAVDEMNERIDLIRARRPSSTSRVIAEVDAMGRLTDLYITPGTVAACRNPQELHAEIMDSINESTLDAARQYHTVTAETTFPEPVGDRPDLPTERNRP